MCADAGTLDKVPEERFGEGELRGISHRTDDNIPLTAQVLECLLARVERGNLHICAM